MPRRVSRSRNGRRTISSMRPPRRTRRLPLSSGKSSTKSKRRYKRRRALSLAVIPVKAKRTKIIVPPDSVRETVFSTKGANGVCRGLTNIYTSAPAGSVLACQSGEQAYTNWFVASAPQLRAVLNATSMAPTSQTGANVDTSSIFWRRAMRTFTITNVSNSPLNMTLMQFVVKRDTTLDFNTMWNAGATDAQGNATDNRSIYGASPFNNPVIPRYFKFKRTYEYTIAPGSTIKHTWIVNMNRTINNELIANDVNGHPYLAGITQCMFMVIKGYPGVAATTKALSTPVSISTYSVEEYRYTYITDNTANLLYAAGSNTGTIGAAVNVYDANGSATTSEAAVVIT